MDGVLIDSEPWYNKATGDMVRGLGYEYGKNDIAKVMGSSYKNIADKLNVGLPAEEITRLYVESLIQGVTNVTSLIDGVDEFLDRLVRTGIKMAIGSSSPREVVEFAVSKFGLRKWFNIIVNGSDADNGKPAPDIYLKCAKLLDVQPAECLVIEDSENGILSGKNAGMTVCAFTGTAHHGFDLSKADFAIKEYTVKSFNELAALLNRRMEVQSCNIHQ
jgi:HAD superfamily hydrolase (TIGR01509 family)